MVLSTEFLGHNGSLDAMDDKISHYEDLVALDPGNIDAHLALASLYKKAGDRGRAAESFAKAAQELAYQGMTLEAMTACKAVFGLEPSHTGTQLLLASLYAREASTGRVAQVIGRPSRRRSADDLIVLGSEDVVSELGVEDLEFGEPEEEEEEKVVLLMSKAGARVPDLEDMAVTSEMPSVRRSSPKPFVYEPTTEIQLDDILEVIDASGDSVGSRVFQAGQHSSVVVKDLDQYEVSVELDAQDASFEDLAGVLRDSLEAHGTRVLEADDEALSWEEGVHRALWETSVDGEEVLGVEDLPQVSLFERFSPGVMERLLEKMRVRRVKAGELVIREGRHHHRLFVLMSGDLVVERRTMTGVHPLAEIHRGEFFGEFELLTRRTPGARVRARTPSMLLEFPHAAIVEVARAEHEVWDVIWSFYHERLLENLMAGSSLFGSLRSEERGVVAQEFVRMSVNAGVSIIREREESSGLYLIASGEVSIFQERQGAPIVVATLRGGDFFGTSPEGAGALRAGVVADRDCSLLFLPQRRLEVLMEERASVREALQGLVSYRQIIVGKTGYSRMGVPH